MDKSDLIVSFIIPAFNEEKNIERTLRSIEGSVLSTRIFEHEIIIIDNGSTDNTRCLAEQSGATVYEKKDGTIASLRNYGASLSRGSVYIFLDADVSLSQKWHENIEAVLLAIKNGEKIITGSHCAPPPSENWFLKYWFQSFFEENESTHVGSAHMVMSSTCFEDVGGFDEYLETGEDYEFCQRANKLKYKLVNNKHLLVIHHDFPKTISQFLRREAWHGIGDYQSIENLVRSKVVQASFVYLLFHFILIFSLLYAPSLLIPCLVGLVCFLMISSWYKFRCKRLSVLIVNGIIFYLYYLGRSLSPLLGLKLRFFQGR